MCGCLCTCVHAHEQMSTILERKQSSTTAESSLNEQHMQPIQHSFYIPHHIFNGDIRKRKKIYVVISNS